MKNSILISAIALCLVSSYALAQYQTAPAYGNGYQQQRKMAPKPQGYGQQQGMSMSSGYGASGSKMNQMSDAGSYDSGAGMMMMTNDEQSGYGRQMGAGAGKQQQARRSGYGGSSNGQQSMGGYGNGGGAATAAQPAANNYGAQSNSAASSYGAGKGAAKYEEPQHPPMPFAWGYDINDGYGATQYHKENGDEYGKRTGSYGYMDAYGVYRNVYYVADENGFRATVKTNEPGTANEAPADVEWTAEEPPANVFMGNKDSGYGSSSSYSSSSSSSDSGNNQQYGNQQSGASSASQDQYLSGLNSETTGAQQQYGSMRMSGMNAGMSAGDKYGSVGMMSSGRQQYGNGGASASASAGAGAGMSSAGMMKQYGMMNGNSGSSAGQQYGSGMTMNAGAQAAGQYGAAGSMMLNAGRGKSSMRSYGSKQQAGKKQQQYNTQAMNTDDQQYAGETSPAQLPEFSSMMMGIASKVQQQQYGAGAGINQEDQALAQQYGPAMQESLAGNSMQMQQQYGMPSSSMLNLNNAQQMQQYGSQSAANSMDGTSTYSSTRMQSEYGAGSRNNDANKASAGDYNSMQLGGGAAGDYGSKSASNSNTSAMDYMRKTAKNMGAMNKRY